MYDNLVNLNQEEIYDILCGCGIFNAYTKDYGNIDVLDEDSIMEEFLPQLIFYINEKLEEKQLILE